MSVRNNASVELWGVTHEGGQLWCGTAVVQYCAFSLQAKIELQEYKKYKKRAEKVKKQWHPKEKHDMNEWQFFKMCSDRLKAVVSAQNLQL